MKAVSRPSRKGLVEVGVDFTRLWIYLICSLVGVEVGIAAQLEGKMSFISSRYVLSSYLHFMSSECIDGVALVIVVKHYLSNLNEKAQEQE